MTKLRFNNLLEWLIELIKVTLYALRSLSFSTRDRTEVPCGGTVEFKPLDTRELPLLPVLHTVSPIINIFHHSGILVTTDEPTMKYHNHPKSIVYIPLGFIHSICSVQLLSRVRLFMTLWTEAHLASLSISNYRNLSKLMSIESVMPSSHFILCRTLLLQPSIFPSIRVFSNESGLFKWVSSLHELAKVVEFQLQHQSFQWTPRTDLLQDGLVGSSLQSKGLSRVFSNTTVQKHQFFSAQLSL